MGRIYEELPCGCLVSEDGGGGFIPCESDNMYNQYIDKPVILSEHEKRHCELHEKCADIYFKIHDVSSVWDILDQETITVTLNSLGGGT